MCIPLNLNIFMFISPTRQSYLCKCFPSNTPPRFILKLRYRDLNDLLDVIMILRVRRIDFYIRSYSALCSISRCSRKELTVKTLTISATGVSDTCLISRVILSVLVDDSTIRTRAAGNQSSVSPYLWTIYRWTTNRTCANGSGGTSNLAKGKKK